MKYYFLSGRNFNLSKAELLSLLPIYTNDFNLEYLDDLAIIVETKSDVDLEHLFHRLGGYLSFGKIISDDFNFVEEYKGKDKVVFGVNAWGDKDDVNRETVRKLGENIKGSFKSQGVSAKFLISNDLSLNAFEVEKEQLIEKGFLLEILSTRNRTYYGLAIAVQDIESFSELEYDKPYTDKRMGVLPSKLARIMVNLTGLSEGKTLWDPFCGSGTILLEGFAKGIHVIGSDISEKAITMAQANVQWLGDKNNDSITKYKTFKLDIIKPDGRILSMLRKTQLDAVVCEPFMGPPQHDTVPIYRARKYLEDVKKMYAALFEILEHSKLHTFKAVIVIPSYRTPDGWATISIGEIAGKKWEIINKKWGGHLQWSRADSIIRRNIFVLSKKK